MSSNVPNKVQTNSSGNNSNIYPPRTRQADERNLSNSPNSDTFNGSDSIKKYRSSQQTNELEPVVVPVRKAESFSANHKRVHLQEDSESITENQSITTWNSPQSMVCSDTQGTAATKKMGQNRPKTTYYYNESSNSTILSGSSGMTLPRSLSPIANVNKMDVIERSKDERYNDFVVTPKATLHRPFDTGHMSLTL